MKKHFFTIAIIAITAAVFTACNKNSTPSPAAVGTETSAAAQTHTTVTADDNDYSKLLNAENQSPQISNLPKVMYVNSTDGLRGRAEPSTNSGIARTFLYGQRIVVQERSASVTIDGITDYWYKTHFGDSYMWLFGGYLSESFPPDAPVLLGMWHFRNRSLEYGSSCEGAEHYIFSADGRYGKSSYMHYVQLGKWRFEGNYIIIEFSEPIPDSMEWSSDEQMESIQLTKVDIDNINVTYYDGRKLELTRCGDPFTRNW